MKVLVTGATSRHCNPAASLKDVSFAHLVAQALRAGGHEVEHRNPSITEDLSGFDRVIVGVSPLHALGSNRAYGCISALMRTWSTGQLIMMIDDWDTGKIFSGVKTMCENPNRLTKPFFAYKLEYDVAQQPEWKTFLNDGVRVLKDSPWPPVIVPQHCWASTPRIVGAGTQLPWVIGIDPTSLILGEYETPNIAQPRDDVWAVEGSHRNLWLDSQRPFLRLPVERHGSGGLPRFAKDEDRMKRYAGVRGVIAPPVCSGNWWTPRPWLASRCGALVLTDWQSVRALGHSWTLTAEQADQLVEPDLNKIKVEQWLAISGAVPTPTQVSKTLEEVR